MPGWLVSWLFETVAGWVVSKGIDKVEKEIEGPAKTPQAPSPTEGPKENEPAPK